MNLINDVHDNEDRSIEGLGGVFLTATYQGSNESMQARLVSQVQRVANGEALVAKKHTTNPKKEVLEWRRS